MILIWLIRMHVAENWEEKKCTKICYLQQCSRDTGKVWCRSSQSSLGLCPLEFIKESALRKVWYLSGWVAVCNLQMWVGLITYQSLTFEYYEVHPAMTKPWLGISKHCETGNALNSCRVDYNNVRKTYYPFQVLGWYWKSFGGHFVNCISKATNSVGVDTCHRDSSIACHVDTVIRGQSIYLLPRQSCKRSIPRIFYHPIDHTVKVNDSTNLLCSIAWFLYVGKINYLKSRTCQSDQSYASKGVAIPDLPKLF